MAFWDKINQATSKVVGGVSGTPEDEATKSIHDEFTPTLGITGKRTIFAEQALVHGSDRYLYSELHPIQLVNKPTTQLMQGVAQAITESGKTLTLVFSFNQTERFLKALDFANTQIALAHGTAKERKYLLQSVEGSKLEVYEDYAQLYYLPTGFKNILNNSMASGGTTISVDFYNLAIELIGVTDDNRYRVAVECRGERYTLDLNTSDQNIAQEAAAYIAAAQQSGSSVETEPELLKQTWQPEHGTDREFTLKGKTLAVPAAMDILNSYRKKFRLLAAECADCARAEYDRKVRDLSSFMDITPSIYGYYTAAMVSKAMEIIVAEGIWSVTNDSFLQEHTSKYHLVMDDITAMEESVALTTQKNQNAVSNAMNFVPHLRGGGFGLKGAVKGIATATAFNVARDTVASSLSKSAVNLNQAQQIELYNRIKPDALFDRMYHDFWNMFVVLVDTLKRNGKQIWAPSVQGTQQARNIFQNLTNPAFPQEKVLDVFLDILKANPYEKAYYQFMIAKFGETEETIAIKDYFGYTSLDDPRIG